MAQKRQDPQEPFSQTQGTAADKPAREPVPHAREVIKVIGVGGGGGNALNRIANSGLDGGKGTPKNIGRLDSTSTAAGWQPSLPINVSQIARFQKGLATESATVWLHFQNPWIAER